MQHQIDRLLKLTSQMRSLVAILSMDDFWALPEDVRQDLVWVMLDLSDEAHAIACGFEKSAA